MSDKFIDNFISAKLLLDYGVDDDDCVVITQRVIYGKESVSAGDFVYDKSEDKMVQVFSVDMKTRMVVLIDNGVKYLKLYDECNTIMKNKEIGWSARRVYSQGSISLPVIEYKEIDEIDLRRILDNGGHCKLMKGVPIKKAGRPPKLAMVNHGLSNDLAEKEGKLIAYIEA